MDFKDQIKQLSDRVEKLKDNIGTEEATKNAFIMPFIQTLGYDVFNPLEVIPEFACDIGTKKGEKIDYAIMKDGVPMILVECKHWGQDLTLHDNQLLRYFHVSPAKFGLLTNGVLYRFYTDLETPNKMDEKPFLEINILDLKDAHIEELKKFHKSYFDVENILSSASELKYTNELKRVINEEFSNPTPDFTKLLARQVYDGMITAKVLEQFTTLVKRSVSSYINDIITERIKAALNNSVEKAKEVEATNANKIELENNEEKIVTTVEEMEGFMIVKSILRQIVDVNRITFKDTQSYFNVTVDGSVRKSICRFYFNNRKKFITVQGEDKKDIRIDIEKLDDIYQHADVLIRSLKQIIES